MWRWALLLVCVGCTQQNLGFRPEDDLSITTVEDLARDVDLASAQPADLTESADLLRTQDLGHEDDLAHQELSDLGQDLRGADLRQPDLQKADLALPDLLKPDLLLPDLQLPDLQLPDLLQPDLADNSCTDNGEPNNSCPGQNLGQLDEGFQFHFKSRLQVNGDLDVFTVPLHEVPHLIECALNPAGPQNFCAEVILTPAVVGQSVAVPAGCGGLSQSASSTTNDLIFKWTGSCLINDDKTLVLRVGGTNSCAEYDLNVRFYPVNTVCP